MNFVCQIAFANKHQMLTFWGDCIFIICFGGITGEENKNNVEPTILFDSMFVDLLGGVELDCFLCLREPFE